MAANRRSSGISEGVAQESFVPISELRNPEKKGWLFKVCVCVGVCMCVCVCARARVRRVVGGA